MPSPHLILDHIAVSAASLGEGVAHVAGLIGVELPPGGAHPLMGTHNHLMRLGADEFLEIIAPDPSAAPQRTRWFGLDHPPARPRLATWVLRLEGEGRDLAKALAAFPDTLGEVTELTRGSLRWQISVPQDGAMPLDGAHPTLIDWPMRPCPGAAMADKGCALSALIIEHPQIETIKASLAGHFSDPRVTFREGTAPSVAALIDTPSGARWLT
ncbi:MAG: VOC family protein [Neomegalonema sp.]|nr:VOC family protein [Neomegalonema sp.]